MCYPLYPQKKLHLGSSIAGDGCWFTHADSYLGGWLQVATPRITISMPTHGTSTHLQANASMINENALSFFQKKCIVHLSTKEIKIGTRLSRERTTNGRIRVDKKPRKLGSHLIHKKCVGYALLRRRRQESHTTRTCNHQNAQDRPGSSITLR